MSRFKGKITFNILESHPDFQYVKNADEKLVYEDVYTFNHDYTKEDISDYIKNDLSLVAGGGYDTKHICNVEFEIVSMEE